MKTYTVYKHTSPDGRVYIGITSTDIKIRWQSGHGYKGNSYFTRAIQKYGWENFTHEILATGLPREDAKALEIKLISDYQSNIRKYGFNISSGGESKSGTKISSRQKEIIRAANLGKKVSAETRDKLRKATASHWKDPDYVQHMRNINLGINNPQYGKKHTEEEKVMRGAKGVLQKSMEGDIINKYISIHEASQITGINRGDISKCCKNIFRQAGGYKWCFT